uniref:Serpentine receptor class gamma n=1 Tax=Parascaris equorum TaxID=6256 RepID=A0A914RGN5_PAREQ
MTNAALCYESVKFSSIYYDAFFRKFLFTPITTFLLFNLLALIGSTVANFVQWVRFHDRFIGDFQLLHDIMPFLLCNNFSFPSIFHLELHFPYTLFEVS